VDNPREYMSHQPSMEPKDMGIPGGKREPRGYQQEPKSQVNDLQKAPQISAQNNREEKPRRNTYQNPILQESPSRSYQKEEYTEPSQPSPPHKPQKTSDNVMSATLLLIRDLDERSLELIKREIEKRLSNIKGGK